MFKEAKANIAAAIILAVLVVGGVLAFLFLYDFPDYYKVVVVNQSSEGFEIVAEDGYNKDRIKEGEDFKFTVTLDPEYATSNITVKVNGEVVNKYETFNFYLIKNVQSDIQVLIEGLVYSGI